MAPAAPVQTGRVALAVGQRGTHGAFLRSPQSLKGAGCAHLRGKLLVYRYHHRAAAVGAGRHELGVTRRVARVAPHRPALGLVAEDGQPRGAVSRTGRLGASSLDDTALLRLHPPVEQLASHVAADE